jgi:hypothetical protein
MIMDPSVLVFIVKSKDQKELWWEVVMDQNVGPNLILRWIRRSLYAKLPQEVFIVHSISVRIYG